MPVRLFKMAELNRFMERFAGREESTLPSGEGIEVGQALRLIKTRG